MMLVIPSTDQMNLLKDLNFFSNVQDDMLIAKDEIFGPVQTIFKFKATPEWTYGRQKGEYSLKNYLQVKVVVTPLKNPTWL
ncbi:aldehyde dehydrogenase [Medicago truncatula]|uniref:Aldehyde dehydrogenase n=1 Tax=Medicago truncatula TaxID=3880 RepID=A0A072TR40_MEDTR|nr:aldehyde dehydrogenase [Medicago truncatula]